MPTLLRDDAGLMPVAFSPDVLLRAETPLDEDAIETLNAAAFGPGRYARTAFRIREAGRHDPRLSSVAIAPSGLVGSVRMTPIRIDAAPAFLLGPLAVAPAWAGRGIGRALVRRALAGADATARPAVLLVGDLSYYGPCGFVRVDPAAVRLPGPVEAGRLLVRPAPGIAAGSLSGEVRADAP